MGLFAYVMALLTLIYAPFNLYRLSYIVTATLVVTIVHQLLAPNRPEDEDNADNEDAAHSAFDPIELINKIKSKLE